MPKDLEEEDVKCAFFESFLKNTIKYVLIGRVWLQVTQRQACQDCVGFAVSSSAPLACSYEAHSNPYSFTHTFCGYALTY